ncbi:hypothetical protein ACA910_001095 [Epithemia clementina (nom. ined.)]
MKVKCGRDRRYMPTETLEGDDGPGSSTRHVEAFGMTTTGTPSKSLMEYVEGKSSLHENPAMEDGMAPPPPPGVTPRMSSDSPRRKTPPSSQRLRRTTLPVDPVSETTAAQRLVEYFVVISCRQSSSGNRGNFPREGSAGADNGQSRQEQPSAPHAAGGKEAAGNSTPTLRPESREESEKLARHANASKYQKNPKQTESSLLGEATARLRGGNGKSSRRLRPEMREGSSSSIDKIHRVTSKKLRIPFHRRKSSTRNDGDNTPPIAKEQYCQPKITARYPLKDHRDNPLNPMIVQFCFPTGEEVTPSKSYQLPRIHYFALTNDRGRKVYGICLTVMEEYHPSAGEQWTQQAEIKDSSQPDVIEVSADKPLKTLFVPKVLCLLSTWPYLAAFREYLAQLYRLATATNVMTAPIERYIVNLCAEIPAPPPGAYEVQVSILDSTIRFWAPPAKLPIAYVALPYNILFECLDLDHILELFCALLMEHKIVLLSSQYAILTICSEILCSLLFPMKWSHLYIPILPKMLSPMLDAPVPYICGVVRENWLYAQDHVASDAIVVDLDRNRIKLGFNTPTIPAPPSRKWNKLHVTLKQSLGNIFERAHGMDTNGTEDSLKGNTTGSAPTNKRRDARQNPVWTEKLQSWDYAFNLAYSPNSELMDDFNGKAVFGTNGQTQWEAVQEAFLRFFTTLFRNYRKYLTIPSSPGMHGETTASRPSFDMAEFLRAQPQNSLPFMEGICTTQQFDDFITRRMYSPGEPELVFFDQSIDAKMNRSRLKLRKVETPFVLYANAHKQLKKIKAVEPNEEGLTEFNFDRLLNPYIYKCWPDLFDEGLFSKPRPVPKAIVAEFDRQALHVSQLRIECGEPDEEETEFYGADYDQSPEVGTFTVFFFAYSALVGLEWQQYKEKALEDLHTPLNGPTEIWEMREDPEPYAEAVEAIVQANQSQQLTADHCINDQCVSDLTMGFCNNTDGVQGINSTLIFVNKSAEETYSAILAKAASHMVELQRTLSKDKEENGEAREARAEFEEAREVASAQLELAFETLKMLSCRGLSADLDAYKSLMEACGRCGDTPRALSLIELMKKDGFVLDGEILSCFVQAFAHEPGGLAAYDSNVDSSLEMSLELSPNRHGESPDRPEQPQDAYAESIRKGLVALQAKEEESDDDRPWLTFSFSGKNKNDSFETEELSQTRHTAETERCSTIFDWTGGRDSRSHNRQEIAKRRNRRRKLTISKDKKVTQMVATQLELGQMVLDYLYPDLEIDTNKQSCPHCSFTLSEDEVVQGWNPCSFEDFTTSCSKCGHRFVPHFAVTCSAPAFKGSQGPGSALFCEFLSPWVVRKALHHVIKGGGVGIQGMLDPGWRGGTDIRSTLYWNLIVLCRRYNLPYTFLLQGSVEGRMILPRLPEDM